MKAESHGIGIITKENLAVFNKKDSIKKLNPFKFISLSPSNN
jgi:hypothetical protein